MQSEHPDLLSLVPRIDLTRPAMIVTCLASGFALAVQPVSAQAQDGWKRMLAWFSAHGVRPA
jgi:hypothetical protein